MARTSEPASAGLPPVDASAAAADGAADATPKKKAKTVVDHAIETGNATRQLVIVSFGRRAPAPGTENLVFSAEHNVAAMMHGWVAHKLATGQDFECSQRDYETALKVANQPIIKRTPMDAPPGRGQLDKRVRKPTYKPHQPAMSQHSPYAAQRS